MGKVETHTRLYRGEPKNATGGQGHHYTRILDKAKGFAGPTGKVYYVDVHMNDMGSLKPSRVPGMNYVVPEKMRNERKLMENNELQKRNKKAQIKYKVIDESFLKRTITFILEADDLTRAEKRKLISPTPNGKRRSFADMSFNQLRAAQKAKKEAEEKKEVKEADESRREHDVNWVKPKKKKEKPGETKFVPEPLLKEPTEEGK